MSSFKAFANILNNTISATLGEVVCYKRGSEVLRISAIIGKTERPVNADFGAVLEMTDRDYIINKTALKCLIDFPRIGDTIEHSNGDIYEVMANFAGSEVYEFSDSDGENWRLHARLITVS